MKSLIWVSSLTVILLLPLVGSAAPAPADQADLIIYLINFRGSSPCVNEPIDFQFTVKNIGTRRSTPSVVGVRVGGSTLITELNCEPIDPGSVRSVYLKNVKLSVPQVYRVTAWADYRRQVSESNEQNNSKFKTFTVITGCPELTISNLYINPVYPAVNETISGYIRVKNAGNCIAGPSEVGLRVGGASNVLKFPVPRLYPQQEHLVQTTFSLDRAGAYRITAYPDYTNRVVECKEGDYRFHSFSVKPGAGAGYLVDLVVSIISITPYEPRVNNSVKFQITVKNIGSAHASASYIGAQLGGDPVVIFSVPGIKAGATRSVYMNKVFKKTGSYRIKAWADFRKMVPEKDETNNTKQKYFLVKK